MNAPLQLIRAAQRGDQEAFAALYTRYGALVYRTACLMLGDSARAEDLVQEVFARVFTRIRQYRPEVAAFSTWLHRITVNTCLNAQRPRLLSWLSLSREAIAERLPGPGDVLATVLQHERERQVWAAVRQLSPQLRAVVVLRYYHDLPYDEIAHVLDCPIGTVRSRLHAAHARLRVLLEEP